MGALVTNTVELDWNANTENDLRRYIIYRNGIQIGISMTLDFTDTTIMPDSTYTYRIAAEDIHGNISGLSNAVVISYTVSTINIKVIPEGFYNTLTEKLNIGDTVKAHLHSNTSPFNVVDSAVSVIDSITFTGAFKFFNAPNETYYIVIKHRNTIETWSKLGGEPFTVGTIMNYDFTNASNKAFGDNMKQVDGFPLRFGIYSGDVNQDGVVDGSDGAVIDNDAYNFVTGYVVSDLTGDGVTDGSDAAIADNNAYNFVTEITP